MTDGSEVDAFEKRLRFGCGFILGGIASLVGLLVIARWINDFSTPIGLAMFGTATLCGFLAMRYGDAFFRALLRIIAFIISQ